MTKPKFGSKVRKEQKETIEAVKEAQTSNTEIKKELRWDLLACIADGSEEGNKSMQEALEMGYEPFAVSPHVTMPATNLTVVGAPAQPKMGNMLWLKRGVLVEVNNVTNT